LLWIEKKLIFGCFWFFDPQYFLVVPLELLFCPVGGPIGWVEQWVKEKKRSELGFGHGSV